MEAIFRYSAQLVWSALGLLLPFPLSLGLSNAGAALSSLLPPGHSCPFSPPSAQHKPSPWGTVASGKNTEPKLRFHGLNVNG